MITNCQIAPERLAPLRECMETYGQEGEDASAEWPWNCLSRRTVAYSCGALRRGDVPAVHNHDEAEFTLCRRLSEEATELMKGVEVGGGSEASDYFAPFYIVASVGAENPQSLNAETIRASFGGVIYPGAEILVEPLIEAGTWWDAVVADCDSEESEEDADDEESEPDAGKEPECLAPWRSLMAWFHNQAEFKEAVFVTIGDSPLDDENGASVFPRLAVGLTAEGSIVGIAGYVVHT